MANKIPVILDTDIGSDIDDTWALGYMLKCPELDVRMVITNSGDTLYKAKVVAKMLQVADRTDVPVAIGIRDQIDETNHKNQAAWIEGYSLDEYPGKTCNDGVSALIELIMASKETITLICIGPLPNINKALRREPRIASKCRFVGMHGRINCPPDYGGECNVRLNVAAAKAVFTAQWESIVITPMDSCNLVSLKGSKYQQVRASKDPIATAIMENYRIWHPHWPCSFNPDIASMGLCDTVAVYLSYDDTFLKMETLAIIVTDDANTKIDPVNGRLMRVATGWNDLPAFEDILVARLTGKTSNDQSIGAPCA